MNENAIKQENVIQNGIKYWVSTVRLNSFASSMDLMFYGKDTFGVYETMIFGYYEDGSINWRELYCMQYSNEEKALQEHIKLVERINKNDYIIGEYKEDDEEDYEEENDEYYESEDETN